MFSPGVVQRSGRLQKVVRGYRATPYKASRAQYEPVAGASASGSQKTGNVGAGMAVMCTCSCLVELGVWGWGGKVAWQASQPPGQCRQSGGVGNKGGRWVPESLAGTEGCLMWVTQGMCVAVTTGHTKHVMKIHGMVTAIPPIVNSWPPRVWKVNTAGVQN